MNRRFLILASAALLAGCVTVTPPPVVAPPGSSLAELEPLYSARAGRDALVIRVSSNGCTKKEDFAFFVERKGEAVTVAFGRKKLDTCKSFAMGHTDLSFSYAELGLEPRTTMFLLNPFYPWTGPGE